MTINAATATTKPILWVGFFVGIIISWGLLTGDHQGRVNILHLVVVYVLLPIFSLIISCLSLLFGKGVNLANLVSYMPLWSNQINSAFLRQKQAPLSKIQFFYQSQLAAVSFSIASLLVFLVLLLTTDVNFVWRSTLLTAENIFPLLEFFALPWPFWQAAQPELSLLIQTQDSRILNGNSTLSHLGDWWEYILAAQIFYAFLLRVVTIFCCKAWIIYRTKSNGELHLVTERHSIHSQLEPQLLAKVLTDTRSDFALNNWCGLEPELKQQILTKLSHSATSELAAGPLASYSEQLVAERWQEPQLILVKGWEPPMGELMDYMQNGSGYLLPLDWSEQKMKPLSEGHLNEWRRFAQSLPKWQVLQLEH